jgi:hypothetical protein
VVEWRERVAGVLAVAVALLAGASLAAGIRTALFDGTPLRAGSFSSADVADLVAPVGEAVVEPLPTSTTSTTVAPVDDTSTTITTQRGTATTTTPRPVTATTSGASVVTTANTTTTVATTTTNRGRSDENRGRGKPADD